MKSLPESVKAYKKTPIFTQNTTPSGFQKGHSTAKDVWAVIWVTSGQLEYHITEGNVEILKLDPTTPGIIEPEVKHYIKACGPASFYVEFFRAD